MMIKAEERNYWIEDTGSGPAWLLLHGFTGSTHTFNECLSYLDKKCRFVKIELPGHARTGPVGTVSMEKFCSDLSVILDKLGVEEINILGYSLGGRTALSFTLLYPKRVNRLILESASPGLPSELERSERREKDQRLTGLLYQEGIKGFVKYWESLPLFETLTKLPEQRRKTIREERLSHSVEGLAQSLQGMGTGSQPSWWDKLEEVRADVLLVTGEEDEKFRSINQHMEHRLSNVSWAEVEGAGHTVHLEKPRVFAKIVEEFMI
ncbi:2-succinyl-6-hydroxy-2,4-cyclohexadiene-1-carboxylate synthase [Halobacillus alkaliphilus]|uniref:Putative 2-succinyl-6-hydroxy-2,4-cyclohexadiene-1-carboxylate synthase n=1 Tax=Halobacillus alkaliphilus TaxID=396056 RepID=A0A1I2NMM8_9BACI|nr:2-succinyl-6-hydroxy-2,4-cyclohexadiene-1-carboxylate synthase [Halobacillus alkaliphilus]SFG02541.1 2-succinyl-6-hydroxy-2,4-cyclohexadiene-1-carboxylate synthase [Halobacillus alkaliphilus]